MAPGGDDDGPDKRNATLASPEPLFGNPHDDHEGDFVTTNERHDLVRGLHQRHIGLIALAGAIVCFRLWSYARVHSRRIFMWLARLTWAGNWPIPWSGRFNSNWWPVRSVARLCYRRSHRLRGPICTRRGYCIASSNRIFRKTCGVPG